jgi:hypothetical protein
VAQISQDELAKFKQVTGLTYAKQAQFFLNVTFAFYIFLFFSGLLGGYVYYRNHINILEHKNDAETVWKYAHKMIELDQPKGKEGNDLDEFNAHRFLEQNGTFLRSN